MQLSTSNFLVMALVLTIGMGLGILIVHGTASTSAASPAGDARQAAGLPSPNSIADPVPGHVAEPAEDREGQSAPLQQSAAARYVGVTFARQSADIVARSAGRLEAVYVNLGDRLKPGDIVARNESYSIDQQLQMAEASLRSTQAEQKNAEVGLKDSEIRYMRREGLAAEGLISREDLETARIQVEKAEASLEVAQAHVAEQIARIKDAQQSLDNTVVRAAFAGTVAARYLDSGATVQSGTPIISLMRSDDLWVRFAVPETRQAFIRIGLPIHFQAEGVPAVISGVIEYVSPGVAVMSQELLVEAKLTVPAALLEQAKAGGSGLVSLVSRVP